MYRLVIGIALIIGLPATDLKLVSALLVITFLASPQIKSRLKLGAEGKAMLNIIDVDKTFFIGEVNEKKALSGVNGTLEQGDFVTVIGGNGSREIHLT